MLCASIIFPITPPELLAAPIKTATVEMRDVELAYSAEAVVEAVRLHHSAAPDLSPTTACVQVANAAVALLNGASHAEVSCGSALALLGLDEGVLEHT